MRADWMKKIWCICYDVLSRHIPALEVPHSPVCMKLVLRGSSKDIIRFQRFAKA